MIKPGTFRNMSQYFKGMSIGAKAILRPRSTIRNGFSGFNKSLKAVSGTTKANDMASLAKKSAAYLGTAAGVTYVSRLARKGNKSPFKDSQGKRDVLPWIPFI